MAPSRPALDPTACAGSARPGQASGKPAFVFRTVLWIRIRMFLGLLDPTACAGTAGPGQASGKLLLCSLRYSLVDPDPYVFGPPGSVSVIILYGLKTDVNVP